MTSYASLRSAVDIMRDGAVDYIPKPFDHNEMVSTVQRILATGKRPLAATPTPQLPANKQEAPEKVLQVGSSQAKIGRASCREREKHTVDDGERYKNNTYSDTRI